MTVLPAFFFSLVADGQNLKVFHMSWMAGCLGIFFFFSVDYNSVEIGTDTNISEKCLAGLLYIKGEKKEPACVFFSIIH